MKKILLLLVLLSGFNLFGQENVKEINIDVIHLFITPDVNGNVTLIKRYNQKHDKYIVEIVKISETDGEPTYEKYVIKDKPLSVDFKLSNGEYDFSVTMIDGDKKTREVKRFIISNL